MSLKSRPAWLLHAVKPEWIGVYRSRDGASSRPLTARSYAFAMAPRWLARAASESPKVTRRSLH